jgi:hypothetical protein
VPTLAVVPTRAWGREDEQLRRVIILLMASALFAAACGTDKESTDAAASTPPVAEATNSPTATTPPSTSSNTTTTTTTTTAPVEDPPSITNPDRPWVRQERDALIARSGLNIEAANCVVDRLEREGFDLRLLVWTDESTPAEASFVIGLCASTLTGGFNLPDPTIDSADDYGDDPSLDRLWDWCEGGDGASCDELWWTAADGSAYEAYAESCGDRGGGAADCINSLPVSDYGESALLDLWYDSCGDGYGLSCDSLYQTDGTAGAYTAFGQTCGERIAAEEEPDCTTVIAELA